MELDCTPGDLQFDTVDALAPWSESWYIAIADIYQVCTCENLKPQTELKKEVQFHGQKLTLPLQRTAKIMVAQCII